MGYLRRASISLVLLFVLVSCTTPELSESAPTAAAFSSELSTRSTASSPAASDPTTTTVADAEDIKASAIASGRPEAAYDVHCEVWQMPKATNEPEKWANAVASTWLAAHDAKCPDAITWPNYFVDTFSSESEGKVTLYIENFPGALKAVEEVPRDFMEHAGREHPELEAVTALVKETGKQYTYHRINWEHTISLPERMDMAREHPYPSSKLTGQAWADEKMDQWLTALGVSSTKSLYRIEANIESWSSPAPGHLVLHVNPKIRGMIADEPEGTTLKSALQGMGVLIIDNTYLHAPDLKKVTAIVEGSNDQATVTRDDPYFQAG